MDRDITLNFTERDGYLIVKSENVPGLYLAHKDHAAVFRDLGPVIQQLLGANGYRKSPPARVFEETRERCAAELRKIVARTSEEEILLSSAQAAIRALPSPTGTEEANAHLMASAPELYAACEQALTLFEDDEGIAQVLMRAIAKARGHPVSDGIIPTSPSGTSEAIIYLTYRKARNRIDP
jgi:hypothetical protein